MSDLWSRLAAGVPQRVERWPGNDGEDIIKDTTAANHTMIEAANRISQLEAALTEIRDHPEKYDDGRRSYAVGWAFFNVQNIARAALKS
jgi:hypothetical protein